MAIMKNSSQVQDAAIAWACQTYGFDRTAFVQAEQDLRTGDFKLAFKPTRQPKEIVYLANLVHHMMNDEFQGEVLRAAVPDLSRAAAELADAILNPKTRVVTIERETFERIIR